ncbi:binding-protein-dependent transport systems inner membrane component [Haloterrigena turkmenica DSM 5511]|uniref:Binding-protein-dependent transport systems inner membrane component n=1 Tax=Haloterrigena turkmenica (strain ATCC 51198 / DSM 5511 / JCM 9101 / NCIMB 13204 / VKM B-1734 / 4k) TaxID=543526 RepID=D2RVW3_HALTV|nr:iron ABC transporter permease [Haloterrigena turkmenica]ADB61392.1 binding-protein-dependent transport systems inner membrane component [Haloterrigena turkmenica DSM 5511]
MSLADRPVVDRLSAGVVSAWLERHVLSLAAFGTAAVLVVMLYLPVGLVFVEALLEDGSPTLGHFVEVLTDPFYFGVLADVFADPLAIGDHLGALAGWLGGISIAVTLASPVPGLDLPVPWLAVELPPVQKGLFGFTAYQAALSTVASVALGLPAAYILANYEFYGRRTLRSLTILPFVLPGIMVAVGFYAMFGRTGTLNTLLGAVGLGPFAFIETSPLAIVILAHAFYNAPLVARLTVAAWESVDARTVETARSLGASPRRAFRDVVAPQLVPAVLTGALLTFIFTFMTFPIVLALGGLQLATVEVWIYDRVQRLAYGEAASLAILETILSLGLTYAYLRYESAQTGFSQAPSPPPKEALFPDARTALSPRRLAVLGYGCVALVLFVGPLASLVVGSVTDGSGFTLRNYAFLVERQLEGASFQTRPFPAIRNSLLFGLATLAVAVPMGVVISVLTVRAGRSGRLVDTLAMLPLAVSGIVFGIGLLQGLVFGIPLPGGWRFQVTGTVAIVAAHAVAAYPFVTRNVSPLLATLDPAMVESARALGASRTRALLDVELPLVANGIVAGAAFAFAISIGEFSSTVILASGSEHYTMPVAVERYLGRRSGPAIAMGTLLLLVTAASFVVVDRVGGRYEL